MFGACRTTTCLIRLLPKPYMIDAGISVSRRIETKIPNRWPSLLGKQTHYAPTASGKPTVVVWISLIATPSDPKNAMNVNAANIPAGII